MINNQARKEPNDVLGEAVGSGALLAAASGDGVDASPADPPPPPTPAVGAVVAALGEGVVSSISAKAAGVGGGVVSRATSRVASSDSEPKIRLIDGKEKPNRGWKGRRAVHSTIL